MRLSHRMVRVAAIGAVVGVALVAVGPAGADRSATCSGDLSNIPSSLGILSGTYSGNVTISGACAVAAGPAVINGNLTLLQGATLVAAFSGSGLTVNGNLMVQKGGTMLIGCNPDSFPCFDDPSATTTVSVTGNLLASQPLGVVVHNTTVQGNAMVQGGGGGVTCVPQGAFAVLGPPAYTDFEDNTINGDLTVSGLQTCWLGSLRNVVGGNIVDTNNTMADPDAGEVVNNWVQGNVICINNSPAVQFGDSGAAPNQVHGNAVGQCGFDVIQPDPNYPNFDGTGGPQPISIKAG
jgi:hypothetical protein